MKKSKRLALKIVCCVLAAVLAAVISYLLYVVLSYYRVEDNQALSVSDGSSENVPVGEPLSLVTYNIGFGAYSADYSFFMDGGEHSRAFSKDAVLSHWRVEHDKVSLIVFCHTALPQFLQGVSLAANYRLCRMKNAMAETRNDLPMINFLLSRRRETQIG